jgi:hypothetical protein
LSPTNVFSPEIETAHFDAVFAGADGALADKTSAARTDAGAAITAFAANGDALYLGWNEKPTTADEYISVALSTPGSSDADLLIQYWSGTEWSTLATSDGATTGIYADHGTKGGSKSGVLQFAVPARWSRTAQNPAGDAIFDDDLTPRFYVRLAHHAASHFHTAARHRHGPGFSQS